MIVIVGISCTLRRFSATSEAFLCTQQTPFSNASLFPGGPALGTGLSGRRTQQQARKMASCRLALMDWSPWKAGKRLRIHRGGGCHVSRLNEIFVCLRFAAVPGCRWCRGGLCLGSSRLATSTSVPTSAAALRRAGGGRSSAHWGEPRNP